MKSQISVAIYVFLICVGFLLSIFPEATFAQSEMKIPASEKKIDENPETLINRRVLILDFVNSNHSADYEYLETSIPDAFLLSKTKSFELMNRSIWQDLLESGEVMKKGDIVLHGLDNFD
jgi:hypothetical protein